MVMAPAQQQAIIEHYIDAYNRFSVTEMLRDLHPEIVFRNVANGTENLRTEGLAAFKAQAEQALPLFVEREQRITSLDFRGETVEVGIDYRGTLAIDLPNGWLAGQVIALPGKSIFTFLAGQIAAIADVSE
jgi:SnoaL-like domain